MLSVVVSANRSHFFGIKVASASYLLRMECFDKMSSVSARDFAPFLWAFIDTDARPTGVPENFLSKTNLCIMFITSPKRD